MGMKKEKGALFKQQKGLVYFETRPSLSLKEEHEAGPFRCPNVTDRDPLLIGSDGAYPCNTLCRNPKHQFSSPTQRGLSNTQRIVNFFTRGLNIITSERTLRYKSAQGPRA
jgi:hypothetical protein